MNMLDAAEAKTLMEQLRLAWLFRWELCTKYYAYRKREYSFDSWNWSENLFPYEEDSWKDIFSLNILEPVSDAGIPSTSYIEEEQPKLPPPETSKLKRPATSSSPEVCKRAKTGPSLDLEASDLSSELQRLAKQFNSFSSENEDDLRGYHLAIKREQFEGFRRLALWESGGRQGPQPLNPLSNEVCPVGHKQDGEMWIVKGESEPFRCAYPNCFYRSNRRNNLQRHLTTMHALLSKAICCCNIHFFAKFDYREHIKQRHTVAGYDCGICGKVFNRKALYDRHLKTHDPGSRFVCLLCRYTTHHKGNMERHSKVHADVKVEEVKEVKGFQEPLAHVATPPFPTLEDPFHFPPELMEQSQNQEVHTVQLFHEPSAISLLREI